MFCNYIVEEKKTRKTALKVSFICHVFVMLMLLLFCFSFQDMLELCWQLLHFILCKRITLLRDGATSLVRC